MFDILLCGFPHLPWIIISKLRDARRAGIVVGHAKEGVASCLARNRRFVGQICHSYYIPQIFEDLMN